MLQRKWFLNQPCHSSVRLHAHYRLDSLAVWLGVISHRFSCLWSRLLLGSHPKKMDKFNIVNRDLSEVTLKLIWHCIFDDRLHIWKTICPEQLCQQAETEQQGAAFPEKYLWFILLGESPLFTVKASVWNNNAFQSSCPGKYCSRLSSGTDTDRPARKEAQVCAKWSWWVRM